MNIDWSKAPEGATHYADGGLGGICVWYKDITATSCKCINFGDSGLWITSSYPPAFGAKPIPVKPWTGEGLPPVGIVCEYLGAHQWDEWTVVNIFASWGKGSSAVVFVDLGDGWREERDPERFRPIRTPEQIAADEREAAHQELMHHIAGYMGRDNPHSADDGLAQYLLDHDYRKQSSP